MKKLKVVQIGIGHDHAFVTYDTLLRRNDIYELCGVCPIDDEMERALWIERYDKALFISLEDVLKRLDLDAVIIETDDWNLTKYAKMFADMGLHVHMDKPGGTSQEEYEELLRTFKNTGKVFHTGYMYRYNPEIIKLLDEVKKGEFGNVYSVEAHMDCEHQTEKRKWLGNFKGGMMYFLGCHLVDLILQFQGVPEEIVPFNFSTGHDGVDAEDVGMAVLKYKNGVSFCKTGALEAGGFMRRQLVVCGTQKCVELRPIEEYTAADNNLMITRRRECKFGLPWTENGENTESEAFNRYSGMMEDFVRIVNGEKQSDYSLEYEARLHRVLLAACGENIDYKSEIKL